MNSSTEEFRPIEGFEGMYEVSNLGRIRSLVTTRKNAIRKTSSAGDGYERVVLSQPQKFEGFNLKQVSCRFVHRLVAQAFIPNPQGLADVNHKDGVKNNNVVENLEWISHRDNLLHAVEVLRGGVSWAKGQTWTRKPVVATPEDGGPPVWWESAAAWAETTGKRNRATNVSKAIRHGRAAYGFYWSFADQDLAFPKAAGE